jgi:tripartite-type tricarboxylate transporter receptor subunit TctC
MSILRAVHASAILAALACAPAAAQTYPVKPIRIVVPYPPGGSGTIVARILGDKLNQAWGQQILVDSRPGASGMIGAEIVAKAPPDGYTLLAGYTSEVAINVSLFPKMAYDPVKDFAPIALTGVIPMILLVHPSVPAKSVKELMALARSRPGEMTYGSAGAGSPAHLAHELLNRSTNVKMVHVPYKGAGPANIALVAGETQVLLTTLGSVVSYIKQGRVRALGVSSADRSKQFPDIPAIAEFLNGYDFVGWVGCFVPAGTPRPVVDTLNAALKKALEDPEIASKLTSQTLDPLYSTPEQFAERLQSDYRKYAELVKISGARIE